MPQPTVSIMMPAYNAELYIGEAIESAISQTYPDWELIIVNDGSRDRTAEIAASYADERIRLVHQENGGESAARNHALSLARGEWLAFLDADDQYLPDHLAVAASYLENHPEKDGVYTDGLHIDPQGNELQSLSSRRRGPFEGWIFEPLVRASDVFGPPLCVVLRRGLIEEHHLLYDTRIVIGPDWDFFIRYAEFANFGYIDQQTCLYRVHLTNITVLTGLDQRAAYLDLCRQKAIKLSSFDRCSLETRTFVFYDLLVRLLAGKPAEQNEILSWPEFLALPVAEKSRILRLMASQAILQGSPEVQEISNWLRTAQQLNPHDRRGVLLNTLYSLSPRASRLFLRLRRSSQDNSLTRTPFEDLATGT
jgi:glycosyltransferase involved in cell wall biosynthesis